MPTVCSSFLDHPLTRLAPGNVASGTSAMPRRLEILSGMIWLTIEGDLEDYWLMAGEILEIPADRRVVVEAHREPVLLSVIADGEARQRMRVHLHGQGGMCRP